MGIPVKNLGTAEIQQAQQQAQAIASAATLAVQPGQFVFFAAFDGTNNNRNNLPLSGTKQPTNVGQLAYQVEAAAISHPNLVPRYYPGPGTEGTITGSSWAPPMVTQQIKDTATQAYNEFNGQAAAWLKANPGGSLTTAITGFSRGGATAVVFAQMLNERGVIDTETGAVLIRPGQVPVAAMLLFDPVSTGYLDDLTIPAGQQTSNLVVIRADNEYRYAFKADDHSANPNVTTIQAQGNHGDIGGFYDQGLGALYLQGATNLLDKAGIPIGAVPLGRQFKSTDAALHSEGIDAYENTIWSEYDATNGRLTRPIGKPIPIQTITTGYYSATSTLNEAGQLVMTVERQIDGHQVKVEFIEDEWGDLKARRVLSVDGQAIDGDSTFDDILNYQGYDAWSFADGTSPSGSASLDALFQAYNPLNKQGLHTLVTALNRTADALSLLSAIQSGRPLPILASGLRLANAIPGAANDAAAAGFNLSGVSNAVSGVLSLMSLDQALKNGDAIGAVTAGAQALSFGASAWVDFAAQNVLTATTFEATAAAHAAFDGAVGFQQGVGKALPALNIINSLAHGDYVGAAIYTISLSFPPLGIAYTVFSLIKGLFGGDDEPQPWASGNWGWNAQGQPVPLLAGGDGGEATLSGLMNQLQGILGQLAGQDGNGLGLIPERLPGLSFQNNTFHLSDLDYVSGAEHLPQIRYTTAGQPFDAPAGSEEGYWSLTERFVRVALEHGALAPQWEADTARLQTQNHLNDAGLTEEDRAARAGKLAGQLAAAPTGTSQAFRPIILDLDGDGIQITPRGSSHIAFDVDDSGFFKATGWLAAEGAEGAGTDGFLWLDRNWNGVIDSGSELFSNARVQAGQRGVPSLAWVDADGDGRITNVDPVWNQLKVWRDFNGNGVGETGEVWALDGLGISALDYAHGRYTMGDQIRQIASPEIEADIDGTRVHHVPNGYLVETTAGDISVVVTRVDDLSALEANRDGLICKEDSLTDFLAEALLNNDSLGGIKGSALTITSVENFQNSTGWLDSNGTVHFLPAANFTGIAVFEYTIRAPDGQTGKAVVEITVTEVNDPPVVEVDQGLRAIYGYTDYSISYPNPDWPLPEILTPINPSHEPYTGWDYSGITIDGGVYGDHTQPIAWEDPDPHAGSLLVTDLETPAGPFTYSVVGQPQMGAASVDAEGNWTYTNWSQPNTPGVEGDTTYNDAGGGTTTYTHTPDSFRVRVTDPQGGISEVDVQVQHIGHYYVDSGGGGGACPIVVDMNDDGFSFHDMDDSNVFAEVNGDGWKHAIAWPVSDPLMALDADGNGRASLVEASFSRLSANAQTDLEGLKSLDSNGDGWLDARDAKWASLGLWFDRDKSGDDRGNGSPPEFISLDEAGIASIDLSAIQGMEVIDDQSIFARGVLHLKDGSTRQYADTVLNWSHKVRVDMPDGSTRIIQVDPSATGKIDGSEDDDLIVGQAGGNYILAGAGDDVIMDDGGDDIVDAGDGDDVIYTGAGDDLIITGEGDNAVFAGMGSDMVIAGAGNDALMLEAGNDIAYAGNGDDFVSGGDGNDILVGNAGDDQLFGEAGRDALFGGTGDDSLMGMEGNDYLNGEEGNDHLDGGEGSDEMLGGDGDDTYWVDEETDVVIELVEEGIDTVISSVAYTLAPHLENLILAGSMAKHGGGNARDNKLTGNSGDNILDGGAGKDTLMGGLGNDTYIVDDADDMVVEGAEEGLDTVRSYVTYTLGANVENLLLTGTGTINGTGNELNNTLTGNSAANILIGGSGDDSLDGKEGADILIGGPGHDRYYIDEIGEVIVELANEGQDHVYSSVSHVLGPDLESLTLTGSAETNATGNSLNNRLFGNPASNILDGGAGSDQMHGGAGNDYYFVDNSKDVIIELSNEGADTVCSRINWTLGAHLEHLVLSGNSARNGTGNELDNVLIGNNANNVLAGNQGNDTLDGGPGADYLTGGKGDDTYIVDNIGDVVREIPGQGNDTVFSSINFNISGGEIENLVLTGWHDIDGIGNELNNRITGNSGSNRLHGMGGNNILDGGPGNDVLMGDKGSDTYLFDRGYGIDTIEDYDPFAFSGSTIKQDIVRFGANIRYDQIWFTRNGNDLEALIIGTADKLTVKNWYQGSMARMEQLIAYSPVPEAPPPLSPDTLIDTVAPLEAEISFMTRTLLDSQVDALVQAMAAFSPPAAGQTSLPDTYRQALAPVLAANWQ